MKSKRESKKTFDKILLIICDQFRFPQNWGSVLNEEGGVREDLFPNYARLRKTGLEFKNCYIASAACNASRACIYTGKYGKETGVTSTSGFGNEAAFPGLPPIGEKNQAAFFGFHPDDPECSLPPDEIIKTLGTHFQANGFRTPYRGKWHLSEVEGHWPDKPYAVDGLKRFGFEGWAPPEGHGNTPLRMGLGADISYVQDAVHTMYELKDTNYKWFMPVNLINPHDVGFYYRWPLKVPDFGVEIPENYETMKGLVQNNKPLAQLIGKWYWNHVTFDEFNESPETWRDYANFYVQLAQIADFNMGILLDTLEATGQQDDTLVVFLSDHGEMGGSHGLTQKWYQAYEETTHVPLIFSNPNFFGDRDKDDKPLKTTDSLASLIDIAPTLLSMAGIELPEGKDVLRGKDLRPILEHPRVSVQDSILFVTDDDSVGSVIQPFLESKGIEDLDDLKAALKEKIKDAVAQKVPYGSKWSGERPSESKFREEMREKFLEADFGDVSLQQILDAPRFVRAIVTKNRWKLVRYVHKSSPKAENAKGVVYEMYDLDNDPGEMKNLAVDEDYKFKLDELKGQLDELLEEKFYHPSMRCDCSEKVEATPLVKG